MMNPAKIATFGLGALVAAACSDAAPVQPGAVGNQVNDPNGTDTMTGNTITGSTLPGDTSQPGGTDMPGGTGTPGGTDQAPPGSTTAAPGTTTPEMTIPVPTGTTPPGTGGGGSMVQCTNSDLNVIPIDETGWVARECNSYGIQGAWYCYDDGINPSGCTADTTPYVAGMGMCLMGSTTVDPDFLAWGAGIGISLNDSGEGEGMTSVKSAYNASANGVIGFHIVLTGDSGGLPIRINFPVAASADGVSPFVEVPGVGDFMVPIADALVPVAWMVPESGTTPDPAALYDVQIQVVGGETAANYNVCVASITPITDGSAPMNPGGMLAPYGSSVCGTFEEINLGSSYMVQNNAYNGANHCIQALWDNAGTAGFNLTSVSANVPTGDAPASYPSIVYGWHVNGNFYGGYGSARQISSLGSVPSSWSFTVPGAGRYNASYDNWIHSSPAPGSDQGTLEQMIWLNYRETTPIGSSVDTITIDNVVWDVWYGPNEGFNTVSYIRSTNTTSATLDLKAFLDDTVSRGYAAASDYFLGVQAGFEIWEANQDFSTTSFSVSAN